MSLLCDPITKTVQFSEDSVLVAQESKMGKNPCYQIPIYTGFTALLKRVFGTAISQTFLLDNGKIQRITIDREGLATYIFCNYKLRHLDAGQREKKIHKFYEKIKNKTGIHAQAYTYLKKEISNKLSEFSWKYPLTSSEFSRKVHDTIPGYFKSTYKGILYKIKKENMTIGYLMGTCHFGDWVTRNLNPQTKQSIFKSKIIAIECVVSFFECFRLMFSFSAEASALTSKMIGEMKAKGFYTSYGAENKLQALAKLAKNQVIGLETVKSQIDLLNKIISKMPGNTELEKKHMDTGDVLCFVRDGDINAIENLTKEFQAICEKHNKPEIFHEFVTSRNLNMTEKANALLTKASKTSRVMIAVGAIHLPGSNGLIEGLKTKGFTLMIGAGS